jgi:hypothetical protein
MNRDWSENMGGGASVGVNNFPAKYSFSISTANCASATTPDFVVFSTGLTGGATQASIVAFDNLYSGCTSPPNIPNTYWAYNTSGQILTSPIFSRNGSQIAFVQTTAGAASLVLLKWQASTTETVALPGTPTLVLPAQYPLCGAPCMTTIALTSGSGGATNDTISSVFYDYIGDTAWVGDSGSWLHRFNPVFNGSGTTPPAEIRTAPWPVQVNATTPLPLSSPVHDHVSGNVFVSDEGGFLYRVSATTGAVTASGRVDFGPAAGALVSGPIVDSTAGLVYVFASSDGSTTCAGGTAPCSAVFAFPANFASASTGSSKVTVGTSSAAPNPLYDGSFDNAYYASLTATGNLYVCGDTGVNPILYRAPITAGTFGTAIAIGTLTPAANHRVCSPVTDILNPNGSGGAAERVFFGVQNNARPTACANGGCAVSFVDMPWQPLTAYTVGQQILIFRPANNTLYINVVTAAGTSAAAAPNWSALAGTLQADGTATWINQGATTLTPLAGWTLNHVYALRARILDSNGNVEIARVGGTSAGTVPFWPTAPGATITDGTVTWVNGGALPVAGLPAAGGTSGMILDNTVGSGTLAGASQVYFSTVTNQVCATSGGTGGCAIQASQPALK